MAADTDLPLVPLFDVRLGADQVGAVVETLESGWLTMGPKTERFEAAFAEQLGTTHAVAVSSCTAALHLAYLAAGVGPGDEVIVPATTFVATASAARYCDATPVFADIVGPHDLGIDPADVARHITSRTKAICTVHFGGYASAVDELSAICADAGIALIEDAAHSPSATPTGSDKKLGTFGLASAFSFFSNKVLSCGEGGLLATDDDDIAALARSLRSHAMTSGTWDRHRGHAASYDVAGVGYNYRLDEPRAALLNARLPGLGADIANRRRLTRRYRALLADVGGLTIPYRDEDVTGSSCYVMPVMVNDGDLRDPLRQVMLDRHRIQTSLLYPAVHKFSAYADPNRGPLPRAEAAARSEVTLPLYPHLTDTDQERVVTALIDGLREVAAR